MDRLAEERRRGITIDLNFAPLPLAGGLFAGVVDVPGHEDFVRTMVAGASGVDLALLVIAADEGVMPQTLEHLAVLEHLGVPAGIPVLTKADLATPEDLELLSVEVARALSSSSVGFEAPIAVSARSGEGLEHLKAVIATRARSLPARSTDDLFRLPVDRAFSVAGIGTVVTGTAWSGAVAIGDAVVLLPAGLRGRVRSIESHGRSLERSEPGARTAVGIAGIDRAAVERGGVLVSDQEPWAVTTALDSEIALDASAPRSLAARSRIRVLLGTAEVMARVLPSAPIDPGGRGLARLALERPIVARGGDRFVVRSYSPVATIGGGRVLDPAPPRRAGWPVGVADADPAVRFRALLERRPGGIATRSLPLLLGVSPAETDALLHGESGARRLGDRMVSAAIVGRAAERALAAVVEYHAGHPGSAGIPLETLRRALRVDDSIAQAALGDLESSGQIRVTGGTASLPGFQVVVKGGNAEIDRIVGLLDEAGLSPPTVSELAARTGRSDLATVLRLAVERGLATPVERDRFYSAKALERFTAALAGMGPNGVITPAMLRERLGVSRKFLIPLLEWADRRGITVRVPEGRRVVKLVAPCGTDIHD